MITIKYTGRGITSKGVTYSATFNDGLYDVENSVGEYLTQTFPKDFSKISNKPLPKKSEVTPEVTQPEKVVKKRVPRKKKVTSEDR